MKLLLDTHTFLWWDNAPEKLSSTVRELCLDQSHTLLLSVESIWEIQVKIQAGKLLLGSPLDKIVREQVRQNNFEVLPLTMEHVLFLDQLPMHHKDPFDRILLAQTLCENAALLSADAMMRSYSVQLIW